MDHVGKTATSDTAIQMDSAVDESDGDAGATSSSNSSNDIVKRGANGVGDLTTVEFGVLRKVPMTVQVEIGRTVMTLGEVLDELDIGSSIRLDRHAGDPVEIYVNGALFALAEVVMVQDQIGARIIELVGPGQAPRPSGIRQ